MNKVENKLIQINYDKNKINAIIPLPNYLVEVVLANFSKRNLNHLAHYFEEIKVIVLHDVRNELLVCNRWIGNIRDQFMTNENLYKSRIALLAEIEEENQSSDDFTKLQERIVCLKQKLIGLFEDGLENSTDLMVGAPKFAKKILQIINIRKRSKAADLANPDSLIEESLALEESETAIDLFNQRAAKDKVNNYPPLIGVTQRLINYLLEMDDIDKAGRVFRSACHLQDPDTNYPLIASLFADYFTFFESTEYLEALNVFPKILYPEIYMAPENERGGAFRLIHLVRAFINKFFFIGENEKAVQAFHRIAAKTSCYQLKPLILNVFIVEKNMLKAIEFAEYAKMEYDWLEITDAYLDQGKIEEAEKLVAKPSVDVYYKVDVIERIISAYISLGELQKALDYAKQHQQVLDKFLSSYAVYYWESFEKFAIQEINLCKTEKYLTEGNMEEALKCYSQLKISKTIPQLENFVMEVDRFLLNLANEHRSRTPLDSMIMITFRILFAINKAKAFEFASKVFDRGGEFTTRFLIKKGFLNYAEEFLNTIQNADAKMRRIQTMVKYLILIGDTANALRLVKDLQENSLPRVQLTRAIIYELLNQNKLDEAKKLAEEIPEQARKVVLKRIEGWLEINPDQLKNPPINQMEIPLKDHLDQPISESKNRIVKFLSSGFKAIAKKIVSFVKNIFKLIKNTTILIWTLPSDIIRKLSSRIYPKRV